MSSPVDAMSMPIEMVKPVGPSAPMNKSMFQMTAAFIGELPLRTVGGAHCLKKGMQL